MFLVIDEAKRTPGTVGRLVSRHKTQRAAEMMAKAIQRYLRRAHGSTALLRVYQSDKPSGTALIAGTGVPATLAQPLDERETLA